MAKRNLQPLIPAALAVIAVATRVGALFSPHALSLDDGAYAVSVVDMRHGMMPYRDLFSSQGPLHYPLLYLGDLAALHTFIGPRVIPVLSGVVATIAVYAIARRFDTPAHIAFVAAALVAISGSMLWTTGPVSADGPATALALCALWTAISLRRSPSFVMALSTGVLFGAALATKPIVFPVAVPIAIVCRWSERRSALAIAAGAAATTWVLTALPWRIGRVWDQSIRFHLDKRGGSPLGNVVEIANTLATREVALAVVVVLALLFGARTRAPAWIFGLWLATGTIALVAEHLFLPAHVASLVPAFALLFALRPPPMRVLAVALVAVVPLEAYEISNIVVPSGQGASTARVVAALRALPDDAVAISDVPGLVWDAGRATPRDLNDNSSARILTRNETAFTVERGAADVQTCAVVVWSFRFARELPGLASGLYREGYTVAARFSQGRALWLKTNCDAVDRDDRARAAPAPVRSPG